MLELVSRRSLNREQLFHEGGTGVWRYREALPIGGSELITLGEGGTPLVRSVHVSREVGHLSLFLKFEGQNPTGSFKDRGMTVAVTRALQSGARLLICASTGNTSASLAAYSARAGLPSVVLVPSDKVARGKLLQAVAYGATIIRVSGNFDRALEMAMEAGGSPGGPYLMNSVNPYRVEGQKTAAFEIYEQLGLRVPDYVLLPVGNAGNISAIWKGFREMVEWGITKKAPKMIGVQASGAAPIAEAVQKGFDRVRPVKSPTTNASAIRIGNPVSWKKALRAIKESGGTSVAVSDTLIYDARVRLASTEGVFVEPASAASVAGLVALRDQIESDATVVCIATGHGLKDQESVGWDMTNALTASSGPALRKLLSGMM